MDVILQEKIQNLGSLGDTVSVKDGYGRNFLLPQGKALPSTPEYAKIFSERRVELEAKAKALVEAAEDRAKHLDGLRLSSSVRTSQAGKLYGSVGVTEILKLIHDEGQVVERTEVCLPQGAIRDLGVHEIKLQLHPDVSATVIVHLQSEGELSEQEIDMRSQAGLEEAESEEVDQQSAAEPIVE